MFGDFRFFPAVQHVALFVAIWLVSLIVLVVVLAIIVHGVRVRAVSATARFLFYIPGAFAGSASVLIWLFLLDPSVSPIAYCAAANSDSTASSQRSPSPTFR